MSTRYVLDLLELLVPGRLLVQRRNGGDPSSAEEEGTNAPPHSLRRRDGCPRPPNQVKDEASVVSSCGRAKEAKELMQTSGDTQSSQGTGDTSRHKNVNGNKGVSHGDGAVGWPKFGLTHF